MSQYLLQQVRGRVIKLSIYNLKSQFQSLLRPVQQRLITWSITPNQITLFTCILCLTYAAFLSRATFLVWSTLSDVLLILFPVFMFLRMALNALDGMIASETDNQTPLGSVLNEMCDVIADAALFGVFFVYLVEYQVVWGLLVILALLTEFLSLTVFQAKGVRSHSGPFGKSDRAVYLGVLAVLIFIFSDSFTSSYWAFTYIMLGVCLAGMTLWNRFQSLNDK